MPPAAEASFFNSSAGEASGVSVRTGSVVLVSFHAPAAPSRQPTTCTSAPVVIASALLAVAFAERVMKVLASLASAARAVSPAGNLLYWRM